MPTPGVSTAPGGLGNFCGAMGGFCVIAVCHAQAFQPKSATCPAPPICGPGAGSCGPRPGGSCCFQTPRNHPPEALTRHVSGALSAANDTADETLSLQDFACQRMVLSNNRTEHVIVRRAQESARLTLAGLSILFGQRKNAFPVENLSRLENVAATLRSLRNLREQSPPSASRHSRFETHLRNYLVALDGHLAGRSYRDIAEVIYGPERVKSAWTHETRHLKEGMRRAVRRGIEFMDGEYRILL
jgi:hypothetical protein